MNLKTVLQLKQLALAGIALFVTSASTAQINPVDLPAELSGWQAWVLSDSVRDCPLLVRDSQRQCAFNGAITLDLGETNGSFSQRAQLFRAGLITLPGSTDSLWPQSVRVDGALVPVLNINSRPMLELKSGSYLITGDFRYERLPERIAAPETSPVSLSIRGAQVLAPERSGDELYLGQSASTVQQENALELEVNRLLSDGYPILLTTKINFTVSGEGRAAVFSPVLPEGFVATGLSSGLRAEMKPDGSLSVQLKPGKYDLTLSARAENMLETLALPKPGKDWPEQETLSFAAAPELRTLALAGLNSVDPTQANVPREWHSFPSYVWTSSDAVKISSESRGRDPSESNRLSLVRELWLDFSGKGYSTKDRLTGSMVKDWRIDMQQPYQMTRAESQDSNGQMQPLLVSKPSAALTGVEVRRAQVYLQASTRLAEASRFPVSGTAQTLESVNFVLNTPPGWTLLGVNGASRADSTWLARWEVFAVFSVALMSLLAFSAFGLKAALPLGVFLVLCWFESGSLAIWIFMLLILALLTRLLAAGWKQAMARYFGLGLWAITAILAAGVIQQHLVIALYPQLAYEESQLDSVMGLSATTTKNYAPMEPPPPPPPPPGMAPAPIEMQTEMNVVNEAPADAAPNQRSGGVKLNPDGLGQVLLYQNKSGQKRARMNQYASNSVIQAGVAEPSWNWAQHRIVFNGPVKPEQQTKLWLLPPWLTGTLRFLAMLALGSVMLMLLRAGPSDGDSQGKRRFWWQTWPKPRRDTDSAANLPMSKPAAVIITAIMLISSAHAAPEPSADILEQLKTQLEQSALCSQSNACIDLSEVRVSVIDGQLNLEAIAQAGARTLVQLPYPERSLGRANFSIDGLSVTPVMRTDQIVYFVLERGVHVINVRAPIRENPLQLSFALNPQRVLVNAPGFDTSGLRDGKLAANSLELIKIAAAGESVQAQLNSNQFPPYVQVSRQLRFDLDWQVVTTVRRLSEFDGGMTIKLPLIAGERPLNSNIEIKSGFALVPIPRGQSEIEFTSNLERSDSLVLTAPALAERSEIWTIEASPTWSVKFDAGVPQSLHALSEGTEDVQLRFDPLPGEALTLSLSRPESAPGPAFRIDSVNIVTQPGDAARDSTLRFSLKATQGGQHSIALPIGAELLSVTRGGVPMSLRLKQGLLELPLVPGSNDFDISIRENSALGFAVRTPEIDLKLASANIDLEIYWPGQRWLMWANGPALGPALLIWPAIFFGLLLAAALARSGSSALGFSSWALLLLALFNVHSSAAAIVIAWFVLLQWRMRASPMRNRNHWLSQIVLVLLSAAAVICIIAAALNGLLSPVDMQVSGYGSSERVLRWSADQSSGLLPSAAAFGMPMWWYRAMTLIWALWLAWALVGWLRYAKRALSQGEFWRPGLWDAIKSKFAGKPKAAVPPLPPRAVESVVIQTNEAI